MVAGGYRANKIGYVLIKLSNLGDELVRVHYTTLSTCVCLEISIIKEFFLSKEAVLVLGTEKLWSVKTYGCPASGSMYNRFYFSNHLLNTC